MQLRGGRSGRRPHTSLIACLSTLVYGAAMLLNVAAIADTRPRTRSDATPTTAAPEPWWTHASIYEIYPRSFQDSNGDGIGDLRGVLAHLDYLQSLGIDAIWLTPFFPSPNRDFGYDVADYTNVAPEYGTLADFDELVKEARKRHIRVLVDLVLNHSSDQHPWFQDSRSSKDSAKRDWYVWRDGAPDGGPPNSWKSIFGGSAWTKDEASGQWFYHIFLPSQPDLNWRNSGLRTAIHDVMRFWLDHGAAGFRLDATPYLFEDPSFPDDPDPDHGPPVWLKPYNSGLPENHAALKELRTLVDRYPGDPILLGESTTATIQDLAAVYGANGDEITLPMDFLIGNLTALDAREFKKQLDDAESKLNGRPPVIFLSSHDHPRQWSQFGDGRHNDRIAKLTATLTLAQRGVALLYYGEEIGMGNATAATLDKAPIGPNRPVKDARDQERTPMPWDANPGTFSSGTPWLPIDAQATRYNVATESRQQNSILNWYRTLLRLRRADPVFRDGEYVALNAGDDRVLAFARRAANGRGALILLNCSGERVSVAIDGLPSATQLGRTLVSNVGRQKLRATSAILQPYEATIVRFTSPQSALEH